MKKKDIIMIFLAVLVCISAFYISRNSSVSGDTVKITVSGELYCEKNLSEDCEININDTNVAVIEDGAIYMKSANCPDKLCIHQGRISDSSKKIICLPNRVIIEAVKKSEIDTVVR